jgi:hypothetical protein
MEAALSMKLLIDRKAQRVLFADASKDVVDFLFSLLALPIATAVKLVGKEAMVGSVGNLYSSVDKLDSTYVQPGAANAPLPYGRHSDCELLQQQLPPLPDGGGGVVRIRAAEDLVQMHNHKHDIFRPYSRPNSFRGVLIRPYPSLDI